MAARTIILAWILSVRACLTFLEQPQSSTFEWLPMFQEWGSTFTIWIAKVLLGYFKAESSKAIMLYCNKKIVGQIHKWESTTKLPKSIVKRGFESVRWNHLPSKRLTSVLEEASKIPSEPYPADEKRVLPASHPSQLGRANNDPRREGKQ